METKKHYKLYKSGKLWMTAMISVAVLGVASVAHADTTEQASSTTVDTSLVAPEASSLNDSGVTIQSPASQSNETQNSEATAIT